MIDSDHPLAMWITDILVDNKSAMNQGVAEIDPNYVIAGRWFGFDSVNVKALEWGETMYQIFGKVKIVIDPNCPINISSYPEVLRII